jgi:serine/threonine protein phosphatase 1
MNDTFPIRQLPENILGKDYVIGDLHGCYSLLERLLDAVKFDYVYDRLFSVGDMIDRGPDSLRCLELLTKPWFFAVQGNHELMMQECFWPYIQKGKLHSLDDLNNNGFLDYGGAWVEAYYLADKRAMSPAFNLSLQRLAQLPLIWVVGEGMNRFNVIHAELHRPDYKLSKQEVWLDRDIDNWLELKTLRHDIEERLLWGRTLLTVRAAKLKNAKMQKGLSTTFCGHTYSTKPRQVLSHLCVDTGAFLSLDEAEIDYGLTLFDVQEFRWFSAAYNRTEIISENFSG